MLTFIIDAFNLIHRVPELKRSNTPHLSLINYIRKNNLTGSSVNAVIVVFDGHPVNGLSDPVYKILYSFSSSADGVIKRKIDSLQNRRQVTVVSDDRDIRDYVKKSGAISLRTGDFLNKIKQEETLSEGKDISYSLQRDITEEMRRIWDKK